MTAGRDRPRPPRHRAPITRRALLAAGFGTALAALSLSGCAPEAPAPRPFRLATGPEGAVYRELGAAYAQLVNREWPQAQLEVLHTQATVENLRLLADGGAECGFANVDAAVALPQLRALARVYDSVLQVVVPSGSPIRSLRELHGRPVAFGLELSGTAFTAGAVLRLLGVEAQQVHLSQRDSVAALETGLVAAAASVTGIPTPAIQQLNARIPVRFVDAADVAEEVVAAAALSYFAVRIPDTTYPGMGTVTALAVPTILAAHERLPDAVAERLTGVFFEHAAELSSLRPEASRINPRSGAATTPVPLHAGAAAWFRRAKIGVS